MLSSGVALGATSRCGGDGLELSFGVLGLGVSEEVCGRKQYWKDDGLCDRRDDIFGRDLFEEGIGF